MPAGVDEARLTGVTLCHREGPGQESDLCRAAGMWAPNWPQSEEPGGIWGCGPKAGSSHRILPRGSGIANRTGTSRARRGCSEGLWESQARGEGTTLTELRKDHLFPARVPREGGAPG